ncbi:hypothetical protein [Microseira sp. BLCC-F43]|jgi:hypothetical protein|uniref:hypothetical protein n=1 Tax=Microseira sp. BLCC-F43 TaxID=3153602 RepID=UPI0035B818E9
MLLLYTKLFGWLPTSFKWKIQPQFNSNPSETELEPQGSDYFRQKKFTEELRQIQQVYHLERRFLL